jgi:hypothetical protein
MKSPDAPFDELSAVTDFTADLPEEWLQGRGLYGGLVTATLIRALEASSPGRPLRSLTSELCGPVRPGRASLRVEVLRAGTGMSTVAVRLDQGAEVLAHGVGVLGAPRENIVERSGLVTPTFSDWRSFPVLPVGPPLGPDFARFFEYRSTSVPFTGEAPFISGWIRPRNPGALRDAAFLAGCIDAYWPAEYIQLAAPRPMATVAFTFQPFVDFAGLDLEQPLFFRGSLAAARAGFAVEFRELWGHDGRLLALNQQTICTIK